MRSTRQSERGFALLLVFLMAGAVALMLYRQLPRTAFESERDKEQLLIDRGEQYRRGIQLFYIANKRYPTTLEELEKFQDKRYLRRRYKDPVSGKDEWRLVHSNGAFLTDSLVTKPPTETDKDKTQLAGTGQPAATGVAQTGAQTGAAVAAGQQEPAEVNAQVLRRPSDRTLPGDSGFGFNTPGNFDQGADAPPRFDPNTPISLTPGTGQPGLGQPANFTLTNQPGVNQNQPNFNQPNFNQPGANQSGANPNQPFSPQFPGQQFPGQQPLPGQVPGVQSGQPLPQFRIDGNGQFVPLSNTPTPGPPQLGTAPNLAGLPQGQNPSFPVNNQQNFQPQFQNGGRGGAATGPGQAPNQAVNLINQLLTTPRQAPAGIGAPLPGGITPGAIGIAGVASTSKAASIKRYKERAKYNEWEFTFELQQGTPGQAGAPRNPGQPGQPNVPGAPGLPGGPTFPGAPSAPVGR